MGQSRISMQLSQLKQAGLVEVRRAGQKSLYRLRRPPDAQTVCREVLRRSAAEKSRKPRRTTRRSGWYSPSARTSCAAISTNWRAVSAATTFRAGVGRAWRRCCCKLMPPLVIADLGAGEGTLVAAAGAARRARDRRGQFAEDGRVRVGRRAERNGVEESRIPAGRSGRAAARGRRGGPGAAAPEPASRPAPKQSRWRRRGGF